MRKVFQIFFCYIIKVHSVTSSKRPSIFGLISLYNSDFQEEQTGTCDLCYGTAWVENGSITVEDENGIETEIILTVWDWGDYDTIYIDNVVNFSAWLQERDVEPIDEETDPWYWLNELVEKYNEGREDE